MIPCLGFCQNFVSCLLPNLLYSVDCVQGAQSKGTLFHPACHPCSSPLFWICHGTQLLGPGVHQHHLICVDQTEENLQIDSGLTGSVLLLTMIFTITVVKMSWTASESTTKSTSNKMILLVNDHCMTHVNSIVCTLVKICKLANWPIRLQ